MPGERIEARKRVIAILHRHADELEQTARISEEPYRSHYQSRANAIRHDAREQEAKLEAFEKDRSADRDGDI